MVLVRMDHNKLQTPESPENVSLADNLHRGPCIVFDNRLGKKIVNLSSPQNKKSGEEVVNTE